MDASWNENGYTGWWFDPYGILTESNCIPTQATNLGRKLVNQVEITYRWSSAYWRSVAGQSMSGFAFPERVTFAVQPTDFTDPFAIRYGPLPKTDALLGDEYDGTLMASVDKADAVNSQQRMQLAEWCRQQGGPGRFRLD